MLQREIVRFRASDTQPNPLEVDYWIDVTSNYYGGCIRYYRNDTNTWEMLNLNDKQVDAIIDYINNALDQIEQFINDSITEIRNELAEFKDELKEEVNKLWQYINQKVEELTTQISNIRNEINGIKQDITDINNNIDDINQDITNINSSIEEIRQDITEVIGGDLSSIQQKITELTQNIQELDSKIDQQISDLRSYINSEIVKAKNELKTYVDGKVADLTELINQEIENRTNADNNLQSQINELKQLITKAQGDIDTHAARRDNPHVVTRAQLSLATTLESSIDDIEQNITSINNKITSIENNLGNVGELLDEEYITQLINKLISENKISVLDPVQQAMNKGTGVTLALPSANSGKISLPIWTGTEAEYNQLTKVAGMTYNIIDEESE